MTEPVKVSAMFVEKSLVALGMATAKTGLNETESINRAIQMYAVLMAGEPGDEFQIDWMPGSWRWIKILRDEEVQYTPKEQA